MGLLSFFKRAEDNKMAAKPVAEGQDAVQQLRLRARRRLIGAAVLVVAGVITFPLVFETQPRPVPVDLPIEIPRKDSLPPLNVPVGTTTSAGADRHAAPPVEQDGAIVNEAPAVVPPAAATEPATVKLAEAAPPDARPQSRSDATGRPELRTESHKPAEKAAEKLADKPAERGHDKSPERGAAKPAERPQDKALDRAHAREAEAARAQALLEGREPPKVTDRPVDKKSDAAAGTRFIVQVGAFAEARAAQDMRAKVEKLGLKTYTQAIETPDGKRIRVRVGPFASRDEADRAAGKLRGSGLAGTVLAL